MGEPPPDEDHYGGVEVAEPELESLVAAARRSRAQVMALDLLHDPSGGPDGRGPSGGADPQSTGAPMTEAQVTSLARRGVVPERDLTESRLRC